MADAKLRVNVTLDPEHAEKLEQMAKRVHLSPGTLARSLLSTALDEANPDPRKVTEILDSIPGAWESAQEAEEQYKRGEFIELDDL